MLDFSKSSKSLIYTVDEKDGFLLKSYIWPNLKTIKDIINENEYDFTDKPLKTVEDIAKWISPYEHNVSSPFHNEPDYYHLKNYLKSKFNWQWIDNAKFVAEYERNFLNIENPEDLDKIIQMRLDDLENKAFLIENKKQIDEFIITPGKFSLGIETKTSRKKTDMFLDHLINNCKKHRQSFCF